MDLNKILIEKNEKKNIKKYKKPNQLRDIESKSNTNRNVNINKYETHTTDEINDFINSEKKDLMKQSWNKLNNGYKLKLISEYIELKKKELTLTIIESIKLKKILFHACENNKLNKLNDVVYDCEEGKITEIKILEFIEKNGKHDFRLKFLENKKKTTTKSKSNIEKFLKLK